MGRWLRPASLRLVFLDEDRRRVLVLRNKTRKAIQLAKDERERVNIRGPLRPRLRRSPAEFLAQAKDREVGMRLTAAQRSDKFFFSSSDSSFSQ